MIYKALRMAREFHRITQTELAKQLHISGSYLSEIESGKKAPSVELLEAYAKVFDIPASTFLLFQERVSGKDDEKRVKKATKMLQFFDWVLEEADDEGKKEKATPTRNARQALHA